MLGKRGIPAKDLARQLEFARAALGEVLKDQAGAMVMEYLNAGLERLPSLQSISLPVSRRRRPGQSWPAIILRRFSKGSGVGPAR